MLLRHELSRTLTLHFERNAGNMMRILGVGYGLASITKGSGHLAVGSRVGKLQPPAATKLIKIVYNLLLLYVYIKVQEHVHDCV